MWGKIIIDGVTSNVRQDINKLIGDVPWKTDLLEQVTNLLHDQRLTERSGNTTSTRLSLVYYESYL